MLPSLMSRTRHRALLALAISGCSLAPFTIAQAADAPPAADAGDNAIVVTGTRSANRKALDSVSPVDIFSGAKLRESGESNLTGALTQMSPAISTLNFGQDLGAMVNSIRLHGLSPDDSLVLINGKRRHTSAYIYASPGPTQGSSAADLDMIPMALIDHVELLRDGAAAQYGSDAIAGVVNIILKTGNHGGTLEAMGGAFEHGDGATAGGDADAVFKLPNGGFLHVSADVHYNDYTNRSGTDTRYNANVDKAFGAPMVARENVGFNAELPLNADVTAYAFGTYAHRHAGSFGFYRTLAGVYANGYSPNDLIDEDDYGLTGGLKGDDIAGFYWDLSSTYGNDHIKASQNQSANPDLYAATGATPTSFYLGKYNEAEWTTNLDLTRPVDLGFIAQPATLALGAEYRRDYYGLGAGNAAATYGSGNSASPGLPATSAGYHHRSNYAFYGDWDMHVVPAWEIDAAGRVEHYSDVGTAVSGKISTRYEISQGLAVRGTFSNGFRAPSLAQEYFSNLGVSPEAASGQLAVNSAAARFIGAKALKPERSDNLSFGLVASPTSQLHFTVDLYQIVIHNRIGSGGSYSGATALEALSLGGYTVPSTITADAVSATYYANVANTRTRGIDATADYVQDLGDAGAIDWSLALEVNRTKVTHVNVDTNGNALLDTQQINWLTHSEPADKITLGAAWKHGPLNIAVHEIRWGPLQDYMYYVSGPNAWSPTYSFHQSARYTTNLEASYDLTANLRMTIGGENIFNAYPARVPAIANLDGATVYDYNNTQIGINGGFLYGKVRLKF